MMKCGRTSSLLCMFAAIRYRSAHMHHLHANLRGHFFSHGKDIYALNEAVIGAERDFRFHLHVQHVLIVNALSTSKLKSCTKHRALHLSSSRTLPITCMSFQMSYLLSLCIRSRKRQETSSFLIVSLSAQLQQWLEARISRRGGTM